MLFFVNSYVARSIRRSLERRKIKAVVHWMVVTIRGAVNLVLLLHHHCSPIILSLKTILQFLHHHSKKTSNAIHITIMVLKVSSDRRNSHFYQCSLKMLEYKLIWANKVGCKPFSGKNMSIFENCIINYNYLYIIKWDNV